MKTKFSLRFAMIMIAVIACFPSMLGGIQGMFSYDSYKLQEKKYLGFLPNLRQRVGVANFITEVEQAAELAAVNAQNSQDAFTNASGLVGLGLILGGLAVILRLWQGPGITTRSRPASIVFSACSTLALILLASFALAAAWYIADSLIIYSIKYISLVYHGM